jgi:hypothetical protein
MDDSSPEFYMPRSAASYQVVASASPSGPDSSEPDEASVTIASHSGWTQPARVEPRSRAGDLKAAQALGLALPLCLLVFAST